MAKKTTEDKRKGRTAGKRALVRNVRFASEDQMKAVEKKAKELGMKPATYLRVVALAGAGYGTDERVKTAALVQSLEEVMQSG